MSDSKIVEFFDGQVKVKYTDKGHTYKRYVESLPITVKDTDGNTVQHNIPNCIPGEWQKIPSASALGKSIFDKPQLYNWFVNITVSAMTFFLKKGLDIETAGEKAKGERFNVMRAAGKIGSAVHNWMHLNILNELGQTDIEAEFEEDGSDIHTSIQAIINWERENVAEYLCTELIVYNPFLDMVGTMDFAAVLKDGTKIVFDIKTGSGVYPADYMQIAFYRETYKLCYGVETSNTCLLHIEKKNTVKPLYAKDPDVNFTAFECALWLTNWKDSL